jgi:serine/threonine-protein kinase
MDYIQLHVTARPVPLNQRVPGRVFPALLEQVVGRALAKRPEDRFASAADFATAMEQVLAGKTQLARHVASPGSSGELPTMPIKPARVAAPVPGANADPAVAGSAPTPLVATLDRRAKSPAPVAPRPQKTNLVLLVGIALGFLLIGVGLAVVLMRFVMR